RGWLEYMQEKSAHPRADPALAMWSARWKKFVALAWLGSCVIAVALLGMQALKTSEGLAALPRVLTASRFGSLWLARAAMLAALGWILFRLRVDWTSDARQNRALWIALALVALLILNQSLTSHNAAVNDPPYIGLIIDFVHLAGVAIWIGGLFQLLFTFPVFLHALPDAEQARHLRAAIGAFSLVAFVTVGIIIFTGALALIFQVGSVQAYFDTLYGASLFVKFLLIVPLLALGALNLLVNRNAALARVNQFFQNFKFAVALEVICAVGIFLVVGVMTSLAPAIAAYDPASQLVVQTQRVEDLKITLGVSSGLVGANDFDVKVVNANDAAISNALVVRILGTHRDMDMGTQEYVAQNQGNGHYTFRGGVFSMAGTWQIEILVRRAGVEDVRTTFTQAAFLQRANASARPLWIENPQALIGLGITLLGFAIGTASALFIAKKKLRLTNLASAIGVALVGMFIVNQVVTSAPPGEILVIPIAPPIARSLRSPVRQDPATLAAGKQIYQENCATCHGESGKGDGATAANLNPKPYDLTVHAPLHAEGELFWWVTYGISNTAMIAWESKLNDLQ
ncbi:MAG: c-type cytochrome, partial [Chloroflexi bacterium]|nr:c-type cytochrome [Chloroflexota bacterium]